MPLFDIAGNSGTLRPAQIVREVPKSNAGVRLALTVTLNLVAVAHCPGDGVNVYVPEF
jgi:hypothetical protein